MKANKSRVVLALVVAMAFAAVGAEDKYASEAELPRIEALAFKSEGMQALHRASDDSIVDDIILNAKEMRFVKAAKALGGKKVFLATGDYDSTVPNEPLEEFWRALGDGVKKCRRTYNAGHSLMGVRTAFASDLKNFILASTHTSTSPSASRDMMTLTTGYSTR